MNKNLKKGQKAENKIKKTLKGSQKTIGSGNIFSDADLKFDNILIESKSYDDDNITFYKKFWDKLKKQAIRYNKIPCYVYTNNIDSYCIMSSADLYTLNKKFLLYTLNSLSDEDCKANDKTFIIYKSYLDILDNLLKEKQKQKTKAEIGIKFEWNKEEFILLELYQLNRIVNKK